MCWSSGGRPALKFGSDLLGKPHPLVGNLPQLLAVMTIELLGHPKALGRPLKEVLALGLHGRVIRIFTGDQTQHTEPWFLGGALDGPQGVAGSNHTMLPHEPCTECLYIPFAAAYCAGGICGKTKVPCLIPDVIMREMNREKEDRPERRDDSGPRPWQRDRPGFM